MKKRTKMNQDTVLENETARLEGTQRVTGEEERRSTSNTVSCDATGSKSKGNPVAVEYRRKRKVQYCKRDHTVRT